MRVQRHKLKRLNLSLWYLNYLAWARLYPLALYHYYVKPFRQNIPRIGYTVPRRSVHLRRRDAFLDALYHTLLGAYTKHTGYTVMPTTGQMLNLFRDLMGVMDETIEGLLQRDALSDVPTLLDQPALRERLALFHAYLEQYHCSEPVMSHVYATLDQHIPDYFRDLVSAKREPRVDTILRTAYVEAGYIRLMMEVVALFNAQQLESPIFQEFHMFGIVGTFGDDLLDFPRDLQENDANLLHALLVEHPKEADTAKAAIRQGRRLSARFWQKHCPLTYEQFIHMVEGYYSTLQSDTLRYACHLALAPGVVGYDYDAPRFRE